jgi:hypothetical protein
MEVYTMYRLKMLLALAGSVLLLATGCADGSTDPVTGPPVQTNSVNAQGGGETWVEDMTGVVYQIVCEPGVQSEPVELHGSLVYRFQVLTDGSGGVHINSSMRPDGLSGVGLDTGEAYRVAERDHQTWLTTQTVRSGTVISRLTMAGRESGQRFTVVHTGHFTINANGDLVAGRSDTSYECR